jgi:hypothetical protein
VDTGYHGCSSSASDHPVPIGRLARRPNLALPGGAQLLRLALDLIRAVFLQVSLHRFVPWGDLHPGGQGALENPGT